MHYKNAIASKLFILTLASDVAREVKLKVIQGLAAEANLKTGRLESKQSLPSHHHSNTDSNESFEVIVTESYLNRMIKCVFSSMSSLLPLIH